uniref:hypothetical protein n=1 Tax=uncultured Campylobacter sp. TaxID=218934 RepID=UPI0026121595
DSTKMFQDFHENGCGVKFALRRKFNPAARRFLLCSTEFVPLRNDKIYCAIWRRGGAYSAVRLFCGQGSATGDKFKI